MKGRAKSEDEKLEYKFFMYVQKKALLYHYYCMSAGERGRISMRYQVDVREGESGRRERKMNENEFIQEHD